MAAKEDTPNATQSQVEEMETNEDELKEASDDSSEEEEDENHSEEIQKLRLQLRENPYLYDAHVELIKLLREDGELEGLREARESMSRAYPLTETLWLEWLRDEATVATTTAEREKVYDLFERAVKDYLVVNVWLEYVQFCIADMGTDAGTERMRGTFERALTACGLHVTLGSAIWEAYRELENALLSGMQPAPGSVATPEQNQKIEEQTKRVQTLFRRQLSVPLLDMNETYGEYIEWTGGDPDPNIKKSYEKAQERLKELLVYEDKLLTAEDPKLAEYTEYIEYVVKCDDPARIQVTFERALQDNCLVPDLWLKYVKYLNTKLQVGSLILRVLERAVRNCPWSASLVVSQVQAMERFQQPHQKVVETFNSALSSGFTDGNDVRLIWTSYCDYLRRRINWENEHEKQLEDLRTVFERGVVHLQSQYPLDGDPNCTLHQYRARVEAKFCKNMSKSRELWTEIMQAGFGNQATMWLEYFNLERAYGDHKHCRKLLQRALNSVSDWPESICEAYLNFEQQEGTLDDYEEATERCEAQMKRVEERRAKAAEKEEQEGLRKKVQRKDRQQEKKTSKKQQQPQQQKSSPNTDAPQFERRPGSKHKLEPIPDNIRPYQRKGSQIQNDGSPVKDANSRSPVHMSDGSPVKLDGQGFKVPPPPGFKRPHSPGAKSAVISDQEIEGPPVKKRAPPPPGFKEPPPKGPPPPGFKGPQPPGAKGPPPPGFKAPPPPGFKPKVNDKEQTPEGTLKETSNVSEESPDDTPTSDPHRLENTAFVSNINYSVKEDTLQEIFSQVGEIEEIRLIKGFGGKSKGYAYVQFKDKSSVAEALKKDREPIDGRPMFVSPCQDKDNKAHAFRYATCMEQNKLFIKNLPFSITKEKLEAVCKKHGVVTDTRLVTYRSGAPKGIAFVEYKTQAEASAAILKLDGLEMDGHQIAVAISNPPPRKAPVSTRQPFVQSLGSGKRDMGVMGKARTLVDFRPRSIQQKSASSSSKSTASVVPSSGSTEKPSEGQATDKPAGKMSNEDFRKMLLKS